MAIKLLYFLERFLGNFWRIYFYCLFFGKSGWLTFGEYFFDIYNKVLSQTWSVFFQKMFLRIPFIFYNKVIWQTFQKVFLRIFRFTFFWANFRRIILWRKVSGKLSANNILKKSFWQTFGEQFFLLKVSGEPLANKFVIECFWRTFGK